MQSKAHLAQQPLQLRIQLLGHISSDVIIYLMDSVKESVFQFVSKTKYSLPLFI